MKLGTPTAFQLINVSICTAIFLLPVEPDRTQPIRKDVLLRVPKVLGTILAKLTINFVGFFVKPSVILFASV